MPKVTAADLSEQEVSGVPPQWRDVATFLIKKAEGKKSSNGNYMMIWTTEIVTPEQAKSPQDQNVYNIQGQEVTWFIMLNEENGNLSHVVRKLLPALGLEPEIDPEDPETEQFVGLYFRATVGTREDVLRRMNPDNPSEYVPVIDPDTGQPVSRGWVFAANFKEILRAVEKPEGYEEPTL